MSQNRPFYRGADGDITLDATVSSHNGRRTMGAWRADDLRDDGSMPNNEIQLFDRNVGGRRSDQQHLINGGRHAKLQSDQQLPQVYGEILTPSTPGMGTLCLFSLLILQNSVISV